MPSSHSFLDIGADDLTSGIALFAQPVKERRIRLLPGDRWRLSDRRRARAQRLVAAGPVDLLA
ncbi:MAG: hypothetical protein WCF24_02240 [Acidimicrobiales bacterium]